MDEDPKSLNDKGLGELTMKPTWQKGFATNKGWLIQNFCNPHLGAKIITSFATFSLEYLVTTNMKLWDKDQSLNQITKQGPYVVKEPVGWKSEHFSDI